VVFLFLFDFFLLVVVFFFGGDVSSGEGAEASEVEPYASQTSQELHYLLLETEALGPAETLPLFFVGVDLLYLFHHRLPAPARGRFGPDLDLTGARHFGGGWFRDFRAH